MCSCTIGRKNSAKRMPRSCFKWIMYSMYSATVVQPVFALHPLPIVILSNLVDYLINEFNVLDRMPIASHTSFCVRQINGSETLFFGRNVVDDVLFPLAVVASLAIFAGFFMLVLPFSIKRMVPYIANSC